jgi:lysophospholipase L1-like esterase
MHMQPAREQIEALNAYRSLWIGDITARYREHGVPVIVFQMPRGPYHMQMVPALPANGAYAAMADAGQVKLLDATTFVDLEQPQYFFDQIHLNSAGRRKLSERLPDELSTLIP